MFSLLKEEDISVIRNNILATNQNKAPSHSIGSYEVLELLGSGAFGSVYKVSMKYPALTKNKSPAGSVFLAPFFSPTLSTRPAKRHNLQIFYFFLARFD